MSYLRRRTIQAVLALSVLLCALPVRLSFADADIAKEYRVKAVFLFNFAQFIKWPADTFLSPDAPICIGILGEDPFGSFLDDTIQGEKVDGHPLVVKRITRVEDVKGCHILYIGLSESKRLSRILKALEGRSI